MTKTSSSNRLAAMERRLSVDGATASKSLRRPSPRPRKGLERAPSLAKSSSRRSLTEALSEGKSSLMADAAPAPAPTASRLEKDARRAAERSARADRERRREEEGTAAAQKTQRSRARARSRKAEQEAKDARWGRIQRCQTVLVKAVHVIDALVGLVCLIYGALIATRPEPATAAVAATLTFGSLLLIAAAMGAVGFYSPRCQRVGLAVSAYTAPLVASLYIFLLILVFDKAAVDAFFAYLTEHATALYLGEAEIDILRKMMPFFYIVLAVLAAVELCRFLLLRHLREKLLKFDAANTKNKSAKGTSAKGKSTKGKGKSGGSRSATKGQGSSRSVLTAPLLDEEQGGPDY